MCAAAADGADSVMPCLYTVFVFMMAGLVVFGSIFHVYVLYLCATQETDKDNARLLWVLLILVTGIIGALVYYFARHRVRLRKAQQKAGGHDRDELLDRALHRHHRR